MMTLEEALARVEIGHLVNIWTVLVDRGEVPEWVWAEDAVVLSPGGVRIAGRENIVRRFRGESYTYTTRDSDVPATSDKPAIPGSGTTASGAPRRTFHNLTSGLVEFQDGENATGVWYYMAYGNDGPSSYGRYFDKYRKIGGNWLIVERKTRLEYLPPDERWAAGRAIIAADREAEARGAPW